MKGDFTRNTFDRSRRYSRVLMQQGRVQLDADWNEQGSIFADSIQRLAADLIGPHGGVAGMDGLRVVRDELGDLAIKQGRYYVAGLPCELIAPAPAGSVAYKEQPYRVEVPQGEPANAFSIIYLDVWERHVTYFRDPLVREVALGGPDTATRAQIVWQARTLSGDVDKDEDWKTLNTTLTDGPAPSDATTVDLSNQASAILGARLGRRSLPQLRAQARQGEQDEDPCLASPEARYRGEENQLYRVEIHDPGDAAGATFKWDSENGSRIFQITKVAEGSDTYTVELASLGRDAHRGLATGDWVELIDEHYDLEGLPGVLATVKAINPATREVTLSRRKQDEASTKPIDPGRHALLRKWDGANLKVTEVGDAAKGWIDLDKGVQIQFGATPKASGGAAAQPPTGKYRNGDYWLIPARVVTGDVEWPQKGDAPGFAPPRGIEHHLAPIALLPGGGKDPVDIRREFKPLIDQRP
jgi:hypothetical protein